MKGKFSIARICQTETFFVKYLYSVYTCLSLLRRTGAPQRIPIYDNTSTFIIWGNIHTLVKLKIYREESFSWYTWVSFSSHVSFLVWVQGQRVSCGVLRFTNVWWYVLDPTHLHCLNWISIFADLPKFLIANSVCPVDFYSNFWSISPCLGST